MKNFIAVVIFCSAGGGIFSQTFSGGGGLIPDDGNPINFTINVSGLPSSIDTLTFGLETVCINLTHTWDSDLDISLIAPDGTNIILSAGNGGGGDDYTNTCFNNSVATSIVAGTPPFTGTFRPQGDMGLINNNQNPNGTWKLHFLDTYPFADQGNLLNWSITFGNSPAVPIISFSSSNLPIIVINSSPASIPDEPKITADMGIIYNGPGVRNYMSDPFNAYNGKIGIEIRGSSSQMFPKKGYGLETRDILGNEINVSLLGMPSQSDWILSASYSDKTLMHNVLSYKLYRDMGRYAPRTIYCELMINGQYMGVYMLMEKIKRDNNRVDIAKLTPLENTGIDRTGGYIIKIDKTTGNGGAGWTSPYPPVVSSGGQTIYFQYEYPSPDSITIQQKNYIQQYVDSFEDALASASFANPATGFRKYCDENSFIDYFILNEISRNVDGYRLSTYLYKDRLDNNGAKLTIGPPWDYDIAWHNANYCNGSLTTGWAYQFGSVCPGDGWQLPTWWNRMMQDTLFKNRLKCRWNYLRGNVLSTGTITNWIDTTAVYLDEGQIRNFTVWPILGIYVWPNPNPISATYAGEITQLKNWITNRMNWLDANMPGNLFCSSVGINDGTFNSSFSIFPNPNSGNFTVLIQDNLRIQKIEVVNSLGQIIFSENYSGQIYQAEITAQLNSGIYFVRISTVKTIFSSKIIVSK